MMGLRNPDIETFTAESEKELEKKLEDFHNGHPDVEVRITNHRVGYDRGSEKHEYAIFYLH